MVINYLILAHKEPRQVARLVDRLQSTQTRFFIHIDARISLPQFQTMFLPLPSNVFFIPDADRHPTPWGDIGLVRAALAMLRAATKFDRGPGHCVLLSGQDYPLRNNRSIENFLAENQGEDFMEILPIPNAQWSDGGTKRLTHYKYNLSHRREDFVLIPYLFSTDFWQLNSFKAIAKLVLRKKYRLLTRLLKRRVFPAYLAPYGGEHWWALSTETVSEVLQFVADHPDYLDYHRDTLLAEETFFQAIVVELRGGTPDNIRPQITYTNWTRDPTASGPAIFTALDIDELGRESARHLFARKFDYALDREVLNLLDRNQLAKQAV